MFLRSALQYSGRGKSGSTRTILAYRLGNKAFFIYGFAKNQKANLSKDELTALKKYAAELLSYSKEQLKKTVKVGELIEVQSNG